jgi:hypothetical protein
MTYGIASVSAAVNLGQNRRTVPGINPSDDYL